MLSCAASCGAPRSAWRGASRPFPGAARAAEPAETADRAVGQAEPGETAEGTVDGPRAASERLPVEGTLHTRYRFRSNGGSDHDLSSTLALTVGDRDRHPATLTFLGWANADLGGRRGEDDPFFDITDTYSKDVTARLYEAHLDLHRVEGLDVLRLGRQPLYDTPEYVSFDGLRLEGAPVGQKALRLGAYGGVPVHHFESSSHGDSVVGAYADLRPWDGGRARLDYMYLEDEDLLGRNRNDLLGARLWQRLGDRLRVEGAYSVLEGQSRDLRGDALWFDPEQDLLVRATYYNLFKTQRDLANEFDPFFEILREYYPFHEGRLLAAKGFAERYRAELGVQVRRLMEDEDEGEFNREFERYHARFVVQDLWLEDLDLGLTGEIHDAGRGKYSSWSADLARQWDRRWKSTVGTFYALYDFDLFALRERNDVRVYFIDLVFRASGSTRVGARYEFEDDDLDDYHVLRVGVTWRF